jgi:hypothetical protein
VGLVLVPLIVAGPLLVVAYNAELFGGVVHTDVGFAIAWGAFPLLTAYVAQAGRFGLAALVASAGAAAVSFAQRSLSTPARTLRRRVDAVDGTITFADGTHQQLDEGALRAPLERALTAMACGMVALAAGLAIARLG